MKIAIVADWIYGGGSERVVETLHKLYPEAPIYTSYCSDEWRSRLDNKVVTGYLQYSPFKQLRKFLVLPRQIWFSRLNLSEYDIIISCTGNGEAKFANTPSGKHISYCYTPVHYYWRHYDAYMKDPGFKPKWLARLGLKSLLKPLKKRDFEAAQKVDEFIAISTHIQKDIKKYYKKSSQVIHPPVDVKRFNRVKKPKVGNNKLVTVGRQVPMKKTGLIIKACKELNLPLTVIGNGPEHSSLVAKTGPSIHFRTGISDEELPLLLAESRAFVFASFEDFGIAPIEAMAAGIPVIAYKAGGALDYIIPGKTGEFFDEQSTESIKEALQKFNHTSYKETAIREKANEFSEQEFKNKIREVIK